MASKTINRLTIYTSGDTIRANEHNAEHQLFVDNLNELFQSFDYEGNIHYPKGSLVKLSFTTNNLEDLLIVAHNSDGTIKADAVKDLSWNPSNLKDFLAVAHNSDGTIKSDGISDPLIYAHNNDSNAHAVLMANHNNDPNAHQNLFNRFTFIEKPSITDPSDGATDFWGYVKLSTLITQNHFEASGCTQIKWEFAADSDFTNIVYSGYSDCSGFNTAEIASTLGTSSTYYVRGAYVVDGHKSEWSDAISFTTADKLPPTIDSIVWNSDKLFDRRIYQVTINATDPAGETLTYSMTCNDPDVDIEAVASNQFKISLPDYVEDTTLTFTYSVENSKAKVFTTEEKTVYDTIGIVFKTDTSCDRNKWYKYNNVLYSADSTSIYKISTSGDIIKAKQFSVSDVTHVLLSDGANIFRVTSNRVIKMSLDLSLISAKQLSNNYYDAILIGDKIYLAGYIYNDYSLLVSLKTDFSEVNAVKGLTGLDRTPYFKSITSDGTYLYVTGYAYNGTYNTVHVAKFDLNLNLISEIYLDTTTSVYPYSISVGNYVYVVYGQGILKFDKSLNLIQTYQIDIDYSNTQIYCNENDCYIATRNSDSKLLIIKNFVQAYGVYVNEGAYIPSFVKAFDNTIIAAGSVNDGTQYVASFVNLNDDIRDDFLMATAILNNQTFYLEPVDISITTASNTVTAQSNTWSSETIAINDYAISLTDLSVNGYIDTFLT